MIWYRVIFVFLAITMTLSLSPMEYEDEEEDETTECGQYGFRCISERVIEFCPIVVDGVTEHPEQFQCEEDYFCDVDNPAYCTPKEPPNKFLEEVMKHLESHDHAALVADDADSYDDIYFDEEAYYKRSRVVRENRVSQQCECEETTTTRAPSTTTDESNDFTTVEFTPAPPFECESYGFFPDRTNTSRFWYCDVPLNGQGYLLRHMVCGRGRYFDKLLKSCVLRGSIRQLRTSDGKFNIEPAERKVRSSLDCSDKKPGKYADEADNRIYHLCLPKQFTPAIQLTFMCPRGTAYDESCKSCTIAAFNRTQSNDEPTQNKINCRSPTRFRSIEDCSGYFLCFVDNVIEIKCPKFYKFDDIALECLPEKVAECKEYTVSK